MAAAAILNYYIVTPDHPRNPFAVLNLSFKFCVDRFYTFRDIAIWKFHKFDLKCLSRPQNHVWEFSPLNFPFYHRDPQKALAQKNAFWALIGRDRCYGVIWTRREEYKKERTKSKPKFAIFADPLSVVPHQLSFACWVVSRISFLVLSFIKIGWKMWEWGANFWLSHWLGTSLIQQLVAIAQAVIHTIQYNGKFALKNWQTHWQFNLAHKLKKLKCLKEKWNERYWE